MTDEGTNGLAIHLANDTEQTVEATLDVALLQGSRAPGRRRHDRGRRCLAVPVIERSVEEILGHFADAGYAFRFGPPSHDLVVATLRREAEILSEAFFFPLGPTISKRGDRAARLLGQRRATGRRIATRDFELDEVRVRSEPRRAGLHGVRGLHFGRTWRPAGGSVVAPRISVVFRGQSAAPEQL